MQDMIFQKGINWNDYPARPKRGSVIRKFRVEINEPTVSYSRNKWQEDENTPVFTQDREYIKSLLPTLL
jgi:tRNA(His) 5'-end guanylyltransferase